MKQVVWLYALACLFAGPSVRARVVYVNGAAAGSVHNGASWGTAYLTIQDGLSAASTSGDEVWVAKGIYPEYGLAPAANVSLYGGFAGTETQRSQRNRIANLTIIDGVNAAVPAVLQASFAGILVDDVIIRKGYIGVYVLTGGTLTLSNSTLTANTLAANIKGTATFTGNAVTGNTNWGIYVDSGTATITGNTISGNRNNAIAVNAATVTATGNLIFDNDYGVDVTNNGTATLKSNTISNQWGSGVSVGGGSVNLLNNTLSGNGESGLYMSGGTASLTNNIIAFNQQRGIINSGGAITAFSHNDVYGNAPANYSGYTPPADQGNLSVDPGISNYYHNIHLQPSSPCRDAGDDAAVQAGDVDVDGQPRIQGAHVDMGSDESNGTLWKTTWYVSPNGLDKQDGKTWATAKKTVGAALSQALGPDEVWVAAGTYKENLVPLMGAAMYGGFTGTETQRSQRDWKANRTVLDGNARSNLSVVECRATGIVLDGFTIRNGSTGVGMAGKATLNNCIVAENGYGVLLNGTGTVTNCALSGNAVGVYVFHGTGTVAASSITRSEQAAVRVEDGGATLTSNVISGNGPSGVEVFIGSATLVNNTVSGNAGNGVVVNPGTSVSLTNNVVAFNLGRGVLAWTESSIAAFSHNDVFGNAVADTEGFTPKPADGNLSADPKLSDRYHDTHLQPGSPCLNAGGDAAVQPGGTDMDGQARLQGSHVDIGADESDGTTWAVPMKTWYVSPAGLDTNDGTTWARAKKTVKAALALAQSPDRVWVAKGVYYENLLSPGAGVSMSGGFGGTEMTLGQRDIRANETELNALGQDIVITFLFADATVDGFTIRNNYEAGVSSASNGTLANCIVTDASLGVVTQDDGDITLVSDLITKSLWAGVSLYGGKATLINTTIARNAGNGMTVSAHSTANVVNSIIAFNDQTGIVKDDGSAFATFSHNAVFGNTPGDFQGYTPPDGQGNIGTDPLFVDRAGGNLRLLSTSPCVDKGDDARVPAGARDLDGKPRILGVRVDIGAYESGTAPPPFTISDVAKALRLGAGVLKSTGDDMTHLNLVAGTTLDLRDAARLARKVAGLEMNP